MKIKTWLPVFTGFYGTIFGTLLEEYDDDGEEVELSREDYKLRELEICKGAVWFIDETLKALNLKGYKGLEFDSLYSPREYNFTNDSINITVECDEAELEETITDLIEQKFRINFNESLRADFTPRDGFAPYYSRDSEDWLPASFEGEFALGYYLDFLLAVMSDDNEEELYEYLQENT